MRGMRYARHAQSDLRAGQTERRKRELRTFMRSEVDSEHKASSTASATRMGGLLACWASPAHPDAYR